MHVIFAALLFLYSGAKPASRPPVSKAPSHVPFYRITKPGSSDTSYLFGTMHLLEASYVDTMPGVVRALRRSDIVVGELAMDSVLTGDALQSMMGTHPLDSILTKKQYQLVSKAASSYSSIPMMMLNMAQPIIAYTVIMEGMYAKAYPENQKTGVPMDLYFQQVAKDSGKAVRGLEEASDQEQVLDSIPEQEQIDDLMELVRHPASAMHDIRTMLTDYRAGKISDMLDDPSLGTLSPEEMSSMLYDRNHKWLTELPDILDRHNAFIAVGAGHLAGKQGLVEGLKKLGYDVIPAKP